jgi:hypothetical protein
MLASDAFLKFQTQGIAAVTLREADAFFRLDDYVVGQTRERKILRLLNSFGDDPELSRAIKELARMVREREN